MYGVGEANWQLDKTTMASANRIKLLEMLIGILFHWAFRIPRPLGVVRFFTGAPQTIRKTPAIFISGMDLDTELSSGLDTLELSPCRR